MAAYGDQYSPRPDYLASVADKVLLNPQGAIGWYGLASTPTFYKDLLSKIGVEMQVFKVGTYKSAVEPFISTEMSPANREQVTVWSRMVSGTNEPIFQNTEEGVSKEKLNEAADKTADVDPANYCVDVAWQILWYRKLTYVTT